MTRSKQFMESLNNHPSIVESLSGLELLDGVSIEATRPLNKGIAFKLSTGQVIILRVFLGESWDKFDRHMTKMQEIKDRHKKA